MDLEEANEDDSGSEVSVNDDSSMNSEDTEALALRADELEDQLYANKYLYEAHVELTEIFQRLNEHESLKDAFRRFHALFPLTPKLWLTWINKERQLNSDQKIIINLYEESVEDYLSVQLWSEYAQFSLSLNDLQKTRSILERGLTAAGLHTIDGSLLWDTYRELEHAHLSLTPAGTEEWKAQVQKLAEVFRRQLSVPLMNMESTYSEWQEWFESLPADTVDPKPIEWGYKKALKTLETYKPFEEKLLAAKDDAESLSLYKEYIGVVTDPSAIVCLYERAIEKLCLQPTLWVDYSLYCLKLGDTSLKVSARAVRNCPWCEELWIMRLRVFEHLGKEYKVILAEFEQGLSSIAPSPGLELWLSYLDYTRRNSDSTTKLDKLFSQAIDQLGSKYDPACKLSRLHARILAKRGDMPTARKLWKNILHRPENKTSANVWLEYANLERQYGEATQVRSIFQRALNATDWPQYIAEEWLMYEREFGTLLDILNCTDKCRKLAKTPADLASEADQSNEKGNKRKLEGENFRNKRAKYDREEVTKSDFSRKRSKNGDDDDIIEKPPIEARKMFIKERHPTTTVFVSNLHPNVTEERLQQFFPNAINIDLVIDRYGRSRCFGYVTFSRKEEVAAALARDRETLKQRPVFISTCNRDKKETPVFKYPCVEEAHKLFVRGLPVSKSKEEVEEIFKPLGAVDVRLVTHKSGQSKGIAYVEFENKEAAKEAIKSTDQMKIDEHVITVAVSAPPPKKTGGFTASSEPSRHARSRLQVPMIPRSLQVKSKETVKDDSGSSSTNSEPPKSNADFRKMFLEK